MNENLPVWPANVKKTKQRKCVYAVLEHAETPLSAMDIFKQLQNEEQGFWLSTVYRILDLFVSEAMAVKTTAMDSGMVYYELNRNRHRHYAVCLSCRKVIEMDNCPMETFVPKLADSEFHVLGHRVEMYGYCKDCDKKPPNKT